MTRRRQIVVDANVKTRLENCTSFDEIDIVLDSVDDQQDINFRWNYLHRAMGVQGYYDGGPGFPQEKKDTMEYDLARDMLISGIWKS